jgi:hypothetical protein
MCAESLRNACTMKEPIRDNKNITNGMYAVQNIGSMTHRLLFSNTVVRCDPFEAPRLTGSPMTYDQIRKHALSVLLQSFSRCCNRSRNLSGRAQNSQNKRPPEGSLSRTLRGVPSGQRWPESLLTLRRRACSNRAMRSCAATRRRRCVSLTLQRLGRESCWWRRAAALRRGLAARDQARRPGALRIDCFGIV